ncbi:MAG TPA: Rrf2 family transcriptional regulator [Pirellulales bacterium]|jgi:Rrf2 family protein
MKLSRTVVYAIQATLQLAQSKTGAPVPCSQLAASNAMPERFLLQILRSLVTHGILSSTRGVVGGYMLQRRPQDVTVLDLLEAIEGPLTASVPSNGSLAEYTLTKLQKTLEDVTAAKRHELSQITLADLLPPEDPQANPPSPPAAVNKTC